VKELKKQKLIDYRRNEAAIIIQRNFGPKHTSQLSDFANITLRSLRSFRKMVNLVADGIAANILNEFIMKEIAEFDSNLEAIMRPAVESCMGLVTEEEVDVSMAIGVEEWVAEMIKLVEMENLRIAAERARLEEEINMIGEEEHSRLFLSQAPVMTKAMLRAMETERMAKEMVESIVADFVDKKVEEERIELEKRRLEEEAKRQQLEKIRLVEEQKKRELEAVVRDIEIKNTTHSFVASITDTGILTVAQLLASDHILDGSDDNYSMCMEEINQMESTAPSHLDEMSFDAAHVSLLEASAYDVSIDHTEKDHQTVTEQIDHDDAASVHSHHSILSHHSHHSLQSNRSAAICREDEYSTQSQDDRSDQFTQRSESSTLNAATAASNAAMNVKEIAQYYAQGKYQRAIQDLNPLMVKLEQKLLKVRDMDSLTPEEIHAQLSKLSVVYSILGLLKARSLFALGAFDESKVLFDAVLKIREETLSPAHYLVGEVQYLLAEWYRANAFYEESEKQYQKADQIFAVDMEGHSLSNNVNAASFVRNDEQKVRGSSGDRDGTRDQGSIYSAEDKSTTDEAADDTSVNSHGPDPSLGSQSEVPLPSLTLFKLYHRNLIGYVELLRQSGQYYKSYQLLKKVQASLLYFKQFDMVSFEVKEDFLMSLIATFIFRGNYSNAISLHQELLDKRRLHYGMRHPKVASSMAVLGKLMLLKANYGEAANYIEESISIRYEFYGNHGFGFNPNDSISMPSLLTTTHCNHPAIASSHLIKSEGFIALGRYTEALIEANRALTIFSSMFKARSQNQHPAMAQCLFVMGGIYNHMGEPLFAKQALDDALTILKVKFTVEMHIKILDCLQQVALSLVIRGLYPLALEVLQYVIQRRDTIIQIQGSTDNSTPLDIHLANTYYALCLVYSSHMGESRELMKTAIHHMHKIVGQQHPMVSRSLSIFSEICKVRGSYADARVLGGMSYDIYSALHGEEHEFICTVMRESADNIRIPGYYSEAMNICNLACELGSRLFSSADGTNAIPKATIGTNVSSDLTASSYSTLVRENMHMGRLLLLRGQILRDSTPLYHFGNYSNNSYQTNPAFLYIPPSYEEAERVFLHVVNIFREKGGENCSWYLTAMIQLADLYRLQRNFNAAERYFLTALNIVGKPQEKKIKKFSSSGSNLQLSHLFQLLINNANAQVHVPTGHSNISNSNSVNAHRSEDGMVNVMHTRGILYLEALVSYSIFLMDIRQYSTALEYLTQTVIPIMSELVGENHVWVHYAKVNKEICELFSSWDSSGSYSNAIHTAIVHGSQSTAHHGDDGASMDYSADNASVISNMLHDMKEAIANLPAVQTLLQFWTNTGFSSDHVWLRRIQLVHYSFIDNSVFFNNNNILLTGSLESGGSFFESSRLSPSHLTGVTPHSQSIYTATSANTPHYTSTVVSGDDQSVASSRSYSSASYSDSYSASSTSHTTASSAQPGGGGSSVSSGDGGDQAYAPKLSVISEGDDQTFSSYDDSHLSGSMTQSQSQESRSHSQSQSQGPSQSQSERSSLNPDKTIESEHSKSAQRVSGLEQPSVGYDDRSLQSDYETRSYISYISQLSHNHPPAEGQSLHTARSHSSYGSYTPRDSPRSVVSGRSISQTPSTQVQSKFGRIEDETIDSWVSGYYSGSLTDSHKNRSTSYYSNSQSIKSPGESVAVGGEQQSLEQGSEISYDSEDFEKEDDLN
jgi:tetratricopeptide (TPR) repeat protein